MRKKRIKKNEVLLSGTMTLRSKVLAGGRQSLYIDRFEDGRHRREFLSLYLEAETTVRARRANAATMRRAEAILRERQSAMLSAQLTEMEEQEHRSTLLSSWLDTYDTYLERRGIDDLHCITTIKLRLWEYAPNATLEQIDKSFILGFIGYLRSEYRMRNGEPLSQKSIFNLAGMFSSSLNYAVSQGRIALNPYNLFESEERVKPGREQGRRAGLAHGGLSDPCRYRRRSAHCTLRLRTFVPRLSGCFHRMECNESLRKVVPTPFLGVCVSPL